MQNTTSVLPKRPRFHLTQIFLFLFYACILGIVVTSKLPPASGPVLLFKKQFLQSHEAFFRLQDPGLPCAVFEAYRPESGVASFLTDRPYDPLHPAIEQLQAAQGRLAPLLLNPEPVEKTAFVFCSRNEIAQSRIQTTGYRPLSLLGDGKMIAEKIS